MSTKFKLNKFLGTSKIIEISEFLSEYKSINYHSHYFILRKNLNRLGKTIYHEEIVKRDLENMDFLTKNPEYAFVKKNNLWISKNDFKLIIEFVRENKITEFFESK